MVRLLSSVLSLPPRYSIGGLGGGDSVVVPLDGDRADLPGPVLNLVAGGGEDDPLHSGDSLFLTLPP